MENIRELAIAKLDFLNWIKNELTNDLLTVKDAS
jgi:hypothetical protein